MKKMLFLLSLMLIPYASFAEVVHLNCGTDDDTYDVVVDFLDDGASVSVNGATYTFSQEYDARAAFYNPDPWMRVEVGRRDIESKYGFATLVDDVPTYMQCEEVQ